MIFLPKKSLFIDAKTHAIAAPMPTQAMLFTICFIFKVKANQFSKIQKFYLFMVAGMIFQAWDIQLEQANSFAFLSIVGWLSKRVQNFMTFTKAHSFSTY